MKRAIKKYFKKTAAGGKCTFNNEMFLGMMVWNVNPVQYIFVQFSEGENAFRSL